MSANLKRKRKRTKNTTNEQYNVYLYYMENDYHFRNNKNNPSLGDNYLEKKWEELKNKLNLIEDGPQLSADEWKKRFTDWKYSVRMRYRKLTEHRMRTGSGPPCDIKLSEIEERALSMWGKVAVTGVALSTYDGVDISSHSSLISISEEDSKRTCHNIIRNTDEVIIPDNPESQMIQEYITSEHIYVDNSQDENADLSNFMENTMEIVSDENKNIQSMPNKRKTSPRIKPLSVLTENLLKTNEDCAANNEDLNNILRKFSEDFIKCQKEELRFKIAVYKFENPTFLFDE